MAMLKITAVTAGIVFKIPYISDLSDKKWYKTRSIADFPIL